MFQPGEEPEKEFDNWDNPLVCTDFDVSNTSHNLRQGQTKEEES